MSPPPVQLNSHAHSKRVKLRKSGSNPLYYDTVEYKKRRRPDFDWWWGQLSHCFGYFSHECSVWCTGQQEVVPVRRQLAYCSIILNSGICRYKVHNASSEPTTGLDYVAHTVVLISTGDNPRSESHKLLGPFSLRDTAARVVLSCTDKQYRQHSILSSRKYYDPTIAKDHHETLSVPSPQA